MICALENCNREIGKFSETLYMPPFNRPVHFCSMKCHDGYIEWCYWQKCLGDGMLDAQPPLYGGQLKESVLNTVYR